MKTIFTAIFAIAITSMSFGQGISGTAHDLSAATWNTQGYGDEICIVCHTPHNAMVIADAPLWNHEVSTATYTLYSSPTFETAGATITQPDGASKLCLACHDGTVALENYGTVTGSTTDYITGVALLGTDLSNDHPISFDYTTATATADGGLYDPSTALSGVTTTGTIDADMLFSNKMQCSSCHDVHNAYGENYLLVKSNSASALCLTCHNK